MNKTTCQVLYVATKTPGEFVYHSEYRKEEHARDTARRLLESGRASVIADSYRGNILRLPVL